MSFQFQKASEDRAVQKKRKRSIAEENGVQRRKLAKQSALFVWNETSICDTSKKESKGDAGRQEESDLFHSV
jgi:hypothetical protein